MSNDPAAARRLLPQSSQMGSFSFAPPTYQQPRETQKNYVFVDEHNRHKRLKVMRACEGCRRRKIKCDAATTNTWPCSACIRLKLHCVRPNGFDGSTDSQVYEPLQSTFDTSAVQVQDGFRQQVPLQLGNAQQPKAAPSMYTTPTTYTDAAALYSQVPYSDATANLHYTTVPSPIGVVDNTFSTQNLFPTPPLQHDARGVSPPESYSTESYGQGDLADLLGSLKMNEAGTAPYLNNKMLAQSADNEDPVVADDDDDYKSSLPPLVSGPGLKIRIPPELMPDDETVLHYFDLFFANVHPYVPVLDRTLFYQQWTSSRETISPLLLEAIFAIGGRLADDPAQGQQWLALASRHADSFLDVPRLSTLQALLIVLKAREAAPKKGYYYRSWMAIVQCVQMGKDLGLDEHYADHKAGRSCDSSPAECMMKTRIWQTIFICEVMIGSPQGRTDLAVDQDSVDLTEPRPMPGVDEAEYHASRNFTYFARVVGNVAKMTKVYARIKKNKDWGADPEFVQLNPTFHAWLNDLPPDMTVNFPPDGSPPWLPSPFIGNLHSYYYLSIIMLHRPQLQLLDPTGLDGQWRHHMMICYSSAKLLCRLEEGILQAFGLTGLQCMQRGVNFTIYSILTCTVLHLVALTSPDPDISTDAREYFTRHMRILEKCMSAWPMPEMQKQIDAVREAFSADTRKPFVLKPSFPYGSPQTSHMSSPLGSNARFRPVVGRTGSLGHHLDTAVSQHSPLDYSAHPISPPISAGAIDGVKSDSSPAAQPLVMMATTQSTQAPSLQGALPLADGPTWNPSRIFDQWNTTFGTPQVQTQPSSHQTSSLSIPPSSGAPEVSTLEDIQTVHASLPQGLHPVTQPYAAASLQTFVTPAMWQESVASVYEGGLKRAWDYDVSGGAMSMSKRR